MLQIGTFFIRIYEKNITKWFTYEKLGSKLEIVSINGTKGRKYEEKDYWNPHFLCSKYMLYGGLIHEFTYT